MKQGASQNAVFRRKLLAVSVAACFAVSATQLSAQVLPTGATGVVGVTGISQAGSTLTVNTSGNSVLNYTSFSIGAGATVQINQQSAAFASLQRVIGAGGVIPQSVIDGLLKSNGRVFLLNPSGVVIGAGARIDVAGFVASSLNMSDEDFLKGRMRFTENAAAKAVKNFGEITTAKGGHVYLVAPEVENHGIIRAPGGQIVLAAGKSAELISDASPYVTVKVIADVEKALNVGKLIADSGSIGMFGALVQHTGEAVASGAVVGPGGQIRFVATKDLTIDPGSLIAANGTSGGKIVLQAEGGTNLIGGTVEAIGSAGKGGEVQALGVRVGVVGNGIIDASGETGGGKVLVGGDYQGKNSAIQNAERTLIGADGVIRADAGANGDGGRVIVWADGDTRFYGNISAKGGSQSGNGGFVETSAKGHLVALGTVSAGAANGKAGTWLLDPDDITIVAGSGANDGEIYGDGTLAFGEMPGGYGSSTIGTYGIYNAMSGPYGTNVVLQANNSIDLQAEIDSSPHAGKALTLEAGNYIALNGFNITTDGDLTLSAPTIESGSSSTLESISGFMRLTQPTTNLSFGATLAGKLGVSTGNIVNDNYDSRVTITSSYGSINTGSIKTSGGGDGGSIIQMTAGYGTISTGDLHSAGSGSGIFLSASGNITTGSLSTKPTDTFFGNSSGFVSVISNSGRVVVNGNIDVSGMDGGEGDLNGMNAGQVHLESGSADPMAVQVTGMIVANGGRGGLGFYGGEAGYGGSGGFVGVYGFSGGVSIGGIQAMGGAGGFGAYGDFGGGDGGSVNVQATSGPIVVGSIQVDGGAGGSAIDDAGGGGQGGTVGLNGASIAVNFITATGGAGGFSEFNEGGGGGGGGSINANSSGSILIGATDSSGGAGGASANYLAGGGGDGGSTSISGMSVTVGQMASRGGAGADGGEGGSGGWGGDITLSASSSSVTVGLVDVSGGNAGTSHIIDGCCGSQSGGNGGDFSISGDNVTVGFVIARGGNGSNYAGGTGGEGGDGGEGNISAVTKITIGPNPIIGASQTVIDLSGGAGGSGGGGDGGGNGGDGGFVDLDPIEMLINGVIAARGGEAGAGGAGIGGSGGGAYFETTGGTGIITFVNGGWDFTAGVGGTDGSVSGQGLYPAPINVAKFIHIGPGDLADIPVDAVGIFRFTSVADPLALAAVAQQVGLTQSQDPTSGSGESSEEEDAEKEKTGSLGSCRPS